MSWVMEPNLPLNNATGMLMLSAQVGHFAAGVLLFVATIFLTLSIWFGWRLYRIFTKPELFMQEKN